MKHRSHSYKEGALGRSLTSRSGVGGATLTAHLQCSVCPKKGDLKVRSLMPPEPIDQKFAQAGWKLDPHRCPDCIDRIAQEKIMTTAAKITVPANAFGKAFALLGTHFNAERGQFEQGWSDQKIAAETGLAPAAVAEFRKGSFGELKEAPEVASLRADIASLEQLHREHADSVGREVAALRTRLQKLAPAAA